MRKKGSLYIEALIATTLIFIFYLLIRFFPFSFELLKPFKQEVHDFDIYDLHFTGKNAGKTTYDPNIVLIAVGNNRTQIAHQLELIRECQPRVIGVDISFDEISQDKKGDSLLAHFAASSEGVIWANTYHTGKSGPTLSKNFFTTDAIERKSGYINFPGTEISVNRSFRPFITYEDSNYPSFATRIVKEYDAQPFDKLQKRGNKLETINYRGNLESYRNLGADSLDYYFSKGRLQILLKDKIVLVGVLTRFPPYALEDFHFTPLNEKFSGRSFPDMYGVVIHANIISMIRDGTYIKTKSMSFSFLLSFLFTFLFTAFIFSRYQKKEHPWHFGLLLLQLVIVILIVYLFLLVFEWFHIKVPLSPIMITLVLSLEMVLLYKKLALWMHKKWGYRTLFSKI